MGTSILRVDAKRRWPVVIRSTVLQAALSPSRFATGFHIVLDVFCSDRDPSIRFGVSEKAALGISRMQRLLAHRQLFNQITFDLESATGDLRNFDEALRRNFDRRFDDVFF